MKKLLILNIIATLILGGYVFYLQQNTVPLAQYSENNKGLISIFYQMGLIEIVDNTSIKLKNINEIIENAKTP